MEWRDPRGRQIPRIAGFPALRARKVAVDKNGLLDAVRGDIPSSIRPYPYGNFVVAAVATVERKATSS